MESRKIIKFGTSSYVITLPQEWMKTNDLNKGDVLSLTKNKNSLLITLKKEAEAKVAQINLEGKSLKLFNRELISYYLKNFKYLIISGKNILERIEEIRILKNKLSSLEITKISNDSITIKDLTNVAELDIKQIILEIVEMEKVLFEELIKSDNESKYFLIKNLDKNINKLSFLAYKAINYNLDTLKNSEEIKNEINYWRIISSLESIGDIIKRIARYLKSGTNEHNHHINLNLKNLKTFFTFITDLLSFDSKVNFENNLKLYFDKKQSLLREFELLRDNFKDNLNLFLVITQLLKDILGKLDEIILSVIDLNLKG